ncbi:uncharacterized protein VTP21DRAFT_3076 [Calcarisporiella thermophila]|uniref:uncharacterized protein n=1 Tax=Calcarisporiella thermophila TaxID=911321 RepID=UPI00374378EF
MTIRDQISALLRLPKRPPSHYESSNPSLHELDCDRVSSSSSWTDAYSVTPFSPDHLPTELIAHIIKQLNSPRDLISCMLVCKAWSQCAAEKLWQRPFIQRAENLNAMLETLSNENSTFQYSRFIRRLNLTFFDVNDTQLTQFSSCHRLERLVLNGCHSVTDEGVTALLRGLHDLLVVDFGDIVNLSNKSVVLLAEHCKRLQGINLALCKNISDYAVETLAMNCTRLKRIKMAHCDLITDASILKLAECCSQLVELDVTECSVSDESIRELLLRCTQLRELRLAWTRITDAAFEFDILPHFEHLRFLDLTACSSISNNAIRFIVRSAPKLRTLMLGKCTHITDDGVFHITALGKNLHFLHLGHCYGITDRAVQALAKHCSRLRYVDLANCSQITDDSVVELAHLPRLRRIGLVRCNNITDRFLNELVTQGIACTTLERVHLSYCSRLSLRAVRALLNSSPRLNHLSLTGVPDFLQPDIQQFCRQAPSKFQPHQLAIFCVFSGKGVKELRSYLNEKYRSEDAMDLSHAASTLTGSAERNEEIRGDFEDPLSPEPTGTLDEDDTSL